MRNRGLNDILRDNVTRPNSGNIKNTGFHIFAFHSTCQNYFPPWDQMNEQDPEAGFICGKAETPLPCCHGKDNCEDRVKLFNPQGLMPNEGNRQADHAAATIHSGWTACNENSS